MGRLIDEADVMKLLTEVELNDGTFTEAKSKLRDLKPAYDVEKVVEQIENMHGVDAMYYGSEVRWTVDKAIEIVRKDGAE